MHNKKTHQPTQRNTGFRAMIPFYILFDIDLTSNDLRIYGQIEQMESNPNPDVNPTFSYEWMAQQLGIKKQAVMRRAKILKGKGYIEHIKTPGGWFWRTVKKSIKVEDDADSSIYNSGLPGHPLAGHPLAGHPKVLEDNKIQQDKKDINKNTRANDTYQDVYYLPDRVVPQDLSVPEEMEGALTTVRNAGHVVTQEDIERAAIWWSMYPVQKNLKAWLMHWFASGCNKKAAELTIKLQNQIKHDVHFKDGYAPNPVNYIKDERWNDSIYKGKASHFDNKDISWIHKKDIFDD
jgi:hypothetical protein